MHPFRICVLALKRGAILITPAAPFVSVAQDVKARIDIVDLISESVALNRSGRTYKARCPFHAEKTPSFVVDPQRQSWRCYGACAEGGDAFNWLQKRENIEFKEALRILAHRAGVRLEPASPEQAAREQLHKRLLEANAAALIWWRDQLAQSAAALHVREYVASRGIEQASVEQFELGFADGDGDQLLHHLGARGFRTDELEQAGLVVITEHGPRDRFRDRLMFPIRNRRGECVGFGGRTLAGDPAKYVNTPESPLFRKRGLLYGLHLAADAIRAAGHVVVVEGYTDVISAHAHGNANTVASMGTSLADAQVALIAPITRDIRFALDSDAAGQAATRRGLESTHQILGVRERTSFDAYGAIQVQDEGKAEVRIIRLPASSDPDTLIREQPDRWKSLVQGAQPFLDFLFDQARARHDLDDPVGRRDFTDELAPIVNSIRDAVLAAEYVNRLAALARVDPRAIAVRRPARQSPAAQSSASAGPSSKPARPQPPLHGPQAALVALAVAYPAAAAALDQDAPDLIDDAEDAQILAARLSLLADAEWTALLPEPSRDRVAQLRAYANSQLPPFTDEEAREAAQDSVERIRAQRQREYLRLLSFEVAENDRQLPHGEVAIAAAALARGDDDPLDPEILPAADAVVQVRDRAVALHAPRTAARTAAAAQE